MKLTGRRMKVWVKDEWISLLTSDDLPPNARWSVLCTALEDPEFGHGLWVSAAAINSVSFLEEGGRERTFDFKSYELHPATWLIPWSAIIALSVDDEGEQTEEKRIGFSINKK